MGAAFERMREALEGRKYVEQYVQKLTHEIKSPLSGIRGAAELLEEDMPAVQRTRFLENIKSESNRIRAIVDRMLALSVIQSQKNLKKVATVSFPTLVRNVVDGKKSILEQKKIRLRLHADNDIRCKGDPLLLSQAISNIIENAIDFSSTDGRIDLFVTIADKTLQFITEDRGPGIPEYAAEKVFDTFFSLKRPDTGKKSTGLGLNFVKEVAALHNGDIRVENRKEGGLRAVLSLPAFCGKIGSGPRNYK
jgi:two-component system sensor histidine kinase CreC